MIGALLTVFVTLRSPRLLFSLVILSLLWTYGLFVYRPSAAQLGGTGAVRTTGGLTIQTRVATLSGISALFLWASGAAFAPLWAAAWTFLITFAHAALRPVSMKASASKLGSDMWSAMGGGGGRPQRPDREDSDDSGGGRGGSGGASSSWPGSQQQRTTTGNRGGGSGGIAAASPQWADSEAYAGGQMQTNAVPHTYEGAQPNLRARANFAAPVVAASAPLPRPGAFVQHSVPPIQHQQNQQNQQQQHQQHQQQQNFSAPVTSALPRPGGEKRRD